MVMKIIYWIIVIALAISTGVWLSNHKQKRSAADAVSRQELSVDSAGTSLITDTQPDNTSVANDPAVFEAPIQALEAITYQPSTSEKNALSLLTKFYEAYNLADSAKLISCFDLSVPVTQVVASSLAAGQPRPTKIVIKSIETRSDGSQIARLYETRSNNQSYEQELELMPTSSGLLVVAYRRSGSSDLVSGF